MTPSLFLFKIVYMTIKSITLAFGLSCFCLFSLMMGGCYSCSPEGKMKEAARKIGAQLEKLFVPEHDYKVVNLADYYRADTRFYNQSTSELEKAGFTFLGDIEDMTITNALPQFSTCIRVFTGDGGTTQAGIYHIKESKGIPNDMRIVDFETRFSNGYFVATTNAARASLLSNPPQVNVYYAPASPIEELLETHRYRVGEYARNHPQLIMSYVETIEGAIEFQQKLNEVKANYRDDLQGLSDGEFTLFGVPSKERNRLLREIHKRYKEKAN
ncbi:hypothetical protein BVX98_07530 [bacterium F11]|nr:hypothetical protein BVX98_07530 [bacterium F11]